MLQESYKNVVYRFRYFDEKFASTQSEVSGKSVQVLGCSRRDLSPTLSAISILSIRIFVGWDDVTGGQRMRNSKTQPESYLVPEL
jgi:hypothetical protein